MPSIEQYLNYFQFFLPDFQNQFPKKGEKSDLQRLTCLISIRNDLGLRGNIFKMLHMAHNALENQFLGFFLPNNQNSFGLKMLPSSPRSFCILTRRVRCCSFKLIASVFSYLSAFEVGTKSGLSLRFSVLPSIVFPIKVLPFRICFSVKNIG